MVVQYSTWCNTFVSKCLQLITTGFPRCPWLPFRVILTGFHPFLCFLCQFSPYSYKIPAKSGVSCKVCMIQSA